MYIITEDCVKKVATLRTSWARCESNSYLISFEKPFLYKLDVQRAKYVTMHLITDKVTLRLWYQFPRMLKLFYFILYTCNSQ